MEALIVFNREEDWPHEIPGAAVATATSCLTGEAANNDQYRQVLNLCRCVPTDDAGFYVSLLAEARGHRPLPSARALEEARTPADVAAVREIEKLAAASAPPASAFNVDAYFGSDPEGQRAALAQQLFPFRACRSCGRASAAGAGNGACTACGRSARVGVFLRRITEGSAVLGA